MESDPLNQHDEMACRELVEVVSDYLEDRLPDADRGRLEQHLEQCPYCVEYVEQMRQTITALGQLSQESLAPEARQELLQAFRGWRER
jgi:anti-sigma factor RsiW